MMIELSLDDQITIVEGLSIAERVWSGSHKITNENRLKGFMGEAAASIFLTGSVTAWSEGFKHWAERQSSPDIWGVPNIEVKTLVESSHRFIPLAAPYETQIKTDAEGFLGMRFVAGMTMEVVGWITKKEAQRIYKTNGRSTPKGTPAILASELEPPSLCPWVREPLSA